MGCEYVIKIGEGNQTPILTEEEFLTVLKTLGIDWASNKNLLDENVKQAVKKYTKDVIGELASDTDTKFALESREDIEQAIKEKSKETKEKLKLSRLDDNEISGADYNFTDHRTISGCTLIEKSDGLGLRMAVDDEAFIRSYIENEMEKDPDRSFEELLEEATKIRDRWKLLSKDGMIMHGIMPRLLYAASVDAQSGQGMTSKTQEVLSEFTFEDSNGAEATALSRFDKDSLIKIISTLNKIGFYLNSQTKAIREEGSKPVRSVYLRAPLKPEVRENVDADYVGVHVDNIYVGKDNRLFVFNYKFCQNPYSTWAKNKHEKYRREMGIIKEIFEQNGFNTDGSEFFNIPIQLVYNEEGKIVDLVIKGRQNNTCGIPYNADDVKSPITKSHEEAKEKYFSQSTKPELHKIKRTEFQEDLSNGESLLKLINPKLGARTEGLKISAKGWIRTHYGTHILKSSSGVGWDVIMPDGSKKHIADNTSFRENKELEDFVQEHLEVLSKELPVVTQTLIDAIEKSYVTGRPSFSGFGLPSSAAFLERSLMRYFIFTEENGHKVYEWEPLLNTTLNQLGIILFQNKNTGQTDVVSICPFKLDERIPVDYDQDNLMGMHEMDTKNVTRLKSSYGDMDCVRVMDILNSVVKQVPNIKLGNVDIYSPYFQGSKVHYTAKFAATEYSKIVNYLNRKFNLTFQAHFKQANFIDNYGLILQEAANIFQQTTIDSLNSAEDVAARFVQIKALIKQLEQETFRSSDPAVIIGFKNSSDQKKRIAFDIYSNCMAWLQRYSGNDNIQIKKIDEYKRYIMATYANPDENVRLIADVFNTALNDTSNTFLEIYQPFRQKLMEFEAKKGVGVLERNVIGSTEGLFRKMFKRDTVTGENLWVYVNPYNSEECAVAGLDSDEIDFLKSYLFFMAKIRARSTGYDFRFTSENDPKLQEYMENPENKYFISPLTKATNIQHKLATFFSGAKQVIRNSNTPEKLMGTIADLDKGPQDSITGTVSSKSIYALGENPLAAHKTLMYSQNEVNRAALLQMRPESYFEMDLGNIAAEYAAQQIWYEKMLDVELQAKALLFNMYVLGEESGKRTADIIKESVDAVNDFVQVNLYEQNTMSAAGKAFVDLMAGPKKMMTALYIAGNIRSMFRDIFEGVMQNTVRTLTHYNTDLLAANVYKGYAEVMQHIVESDKALNILSELCLRYRLSNCDTAKIAERAKRGTGGILNPMYASFGTLRGPDFLNRMTLFVARCMQDGCWDAFDMENGKLVYDPRKDQRFKAYFDGVKGSPEYLKAKSMYFSAVLSYNDAHKQSKPIVIGQDLLPEPYSDRQIKSIKEFADGIYGAYDKSQKAKYERMALGSQLGIFTTWMNGHVAAWLKEPGTYSSHYTSLDENGETIIRKSDAGNDLYFDENGGLVEKIGDKFYDCVTGEEVQNDGTCPVVGDVPIFVQGIAYTLRDIWKLLRQEKMLTPQKFKEKIWSAQTNRENLKKLLGDAFMLLLYGLLFGLLLTPKYKEHVKSKECNNLIVDGMTELFYKAGHAAFDGFMGPYAVVNYLLNDMGPTTINSDLYFIRNSAKYLMGKQTFKAFMYSNLPIFRTFKDTAKMYDNDAFKIIKDE